MKLKYLPGALVAMVLLAAMLLLTVQAQPVLAQTVATPGLENDTAGHLRAPGQIMVKFKPGINLKSVSAPQDAPAEIQNLFTRLGVKKMTGLGGDTNVFLLYVSGPVDESLQVAMADPAVEKADANQLVKLDQASTVEPNDPIFLQGKQWWLDRIHAPEAWTITTGSKDIKVGVVDDGVDAAHPDLAGKVVAAYNFAEETPVSRPGLEGHGTSVAGCITANTDNGQGITGLNWNVSLIDGKGFGPQAQGFSFDLTRGIIFAVDKGARVINNSWGGGGLDLATVAATEYAASKNVILVFSSGNSGFNEPQLPGALSLVYPNLITVGATDYNDQVVGFSTFGPQVNLVAPGSGIWTTEPGGKYRGINGTSFSAPIVTGVVALMLSVNPNLTPLQVRTILEGTADDISGVGFTYKTGYGRVNAYKAVLAAKNDDLNPGKQSVITGKVSGVDPAKVRLSLDPISLNIKPDASGNFRVANLGKATYRLRAAVTGVGTGQGVVEFKLSGATGSTYQANFAFQNVKASASAPDNYVDQARFFDARATSQASGGALYYQQTGHSLSGVFRSYWEAHGGLAVFGYPISEEFTEVSPTDGKLYRVQYFQRNRFELHPENAGTPYEVLLGLLGREQTTDRNFASGAPVENGLWFPETGQALSGQFLDYWQAKGGLAIFGYPISGVIEENGQQVQYFERNRFELHPENAGTDYQVLLGLLGINLARQRGYLS
jgi:subtilisin family serine protease